MTDVSARRAPEPGTVWREQLRVTGLAVRLEAGLALGALALLLLGGVLLVRVPALSALSGDPSPATDLFDPAEPGFGFVGVLTALILAVLVWKGERPYGDSPLWSLPVDHRRHMLTKVAAGWSWLMAIVGAAYLGLVLAVIGAGGELGAEEIRPLIIDSGAFFAGLPGGTRDVAWTTPWWEWALPLTSATAAYLTASALWLGTRRPWVWAVAIWMISLFLFSAAEEYEIEPLLRGIDLLGWFIGADDFSGYARLPTGEFAQGWARLPTLGLWLGSCVFWIGLGATGVLAASSRPRDH
jgi:hypothetical protein